MRFLHLSWGMQTTLAIRVAAITGFFAVALGAFGAHGLKATLDQNGTLAIWQTAALYHLVHLSFPKKPLV